MSLSILARSARRTRGGRRARSRLHAGRRLSTTRRGRVYVRDGAPFVFEAVQPVKLTPLGEWIERGERGHFVAKRLRDPEQRLTPAVLDETVISPAAMFAALALVTVYER